MDFTESQIRKLRYKLNAYRAQKGRGGKVRPWKSVINDILMSEATAHCYPEDGSMPEFKEEALRRFSAGSSTPSLDKLEDIKAFLISARFLTEDELLSDSSWNHHFIHSFSQFLGTPTENLELIENLQGNYSAVVKTTLGDQELEESIYLKVELWDDNFLKRVSPDFRKIEGGYGFLFNSGRLMFVFKDEYSGKVSFLQICRLKTVESFIALKLDSNSLQFETMPELALNDLVKTYEFKVASSKRQHPGEMVLAVRFEHPSTLVE